MSFLQKALLQVKHKPISQFVRFRRVNVQKPRAPFYEKARILAVCEPKFLNPNYNKTLAERCQKEIEKNKKTEEDNPFEAILAKECLNWFVHSKMIAIFHENPIEEIEKFPIRVLFKKQNMTLKKFAKSVLRRALETTKYREILPLFEAPHILVFSSDLQLAPLLKVCKRAPQFVLLCCIAENRILSKEEIVHYSLLPDLQTAQASLVSVLNSASSSLVQNLTQHQMILVGHLDKHAEQLRELNNPAHPTEENSDSR